jgi:hypothetical protein
MVLLHEQDLQNHLGDALALQAGVVAGIGGGSDASSRMSNLAVAIQKRLAGESLAAR